MCIYFIYIHNHIYLRKIYAPTLMQSYKCLFQGEIYYCSIYYIFRLGCFIHCENSVRVFDPKSLTFLLIFFYFSLPTEFYGGGLGRKALK